MSQFTPIFRRCSLTRSAKGAALAVVLASAWPVLATASEPSPQWLSQSQVSLSQAVALAEQHSGGKASRAEFEQDDHHALMVDVEVIKGEQVMDVKVDAVKGIVASAKTDPRDDDDEADQVD